MLLRTFHDRALAQNAYLIGCAETGEALIIDPARDLSPCLQAARQEGLRITQVTETHIHADFASGIRELAAHTGATMLLSAEGDTDWQYAFADDQTILLHDGDVFWVGNVKIEVLHTPGHTPEHLVFQFTDTKNADQPLGLFTGDCLFVGDVGRPDLLETAAGIAGSKEEGAHGQFRNIKRLKSMPDYLMILPGHGAGSACGKALGAMPSSTLGYEKRFNPAFHYTDESAFVDWLLADQPETPPYFNYMKRINRLGVPLLAQASAPQPMELFVLYEVLKNGVLVIDTRPVDEFALGHVPGTINIPPSYKFNTYAGWIVDYDQPLYLIAPSAAIPELTRKLQGIGFDHIAGYFPEDEVEAALDSSAESLATVEPAEAAAIIESGAVILDVRSRSEFANERIGCARHIIYGQVREQIDDLPRDLPLLLYCETGYRSVLASSILQANGFSNMVNLHGGIEAWQAAGLPVENEGIIRR
jgi:hydroxyacylglutathione hydrolase